MDKTIEIWKDVNHPVFKDFYQVSNLGRLKYKPRIITRGGDSNRYSYIRPERICTSFRSGKFPHLFTSLYSDVDGFKNKTAYIHKLVAEAFIPKPSEEHVHVTHLDWDYHNNRVTNLKWITATENSKRSMVMYPENKNKIKETNIKNGYYDSLKSEARKYKSLIKAMYEKGYTQIQIAEKFNCSNGTISNILNK
jgi:hypothetical protein